MSLCDVLPNTRRFLALAVAVAAMTGCAVKRSRTSAAKGNMVVDGIGWVIYGGDVENPLEETHRRDRPFDGCGHETGAVKLFAPTSDSKEIPVAWNDETRWRSFSRPAGHEGCLAHERRDEQQRLCWADYGLQFYPSTPIVGGNRFVVPGTSPVFRVVERSEYPTDDAQLCRFNRDTALIWVAGVGNRGLGVSWRTTDKELMASLMAWNRNRDFPAATSDEPAGHGKLREAPGYIQFVQNENGPMNGAWGKHSDIGIRMMLANLEMAYRAGVSHVEVVSHSNGLITSQLGVALFLMRFNRNLWQPNDWLGMPWSDSTLQEAEENFNHLVEDRRRSGKPMQMTINIYHLQAAPHELLASSRLDKYGFVSDFMPTMRWIRRSFAGLSYRGWERLTPEFFKAASPYVSVSTRFYYNGPDLMTYDLYHTLSVGSRRSLAWERSMLNMQTGGIPLVRHYLCRSAAQDVCGAGHDQNGSLWDFSSPMLSSGKPMEWKKW